jgi:anaerobic selenocysteine-containing dehydrogenase
VFSAGFICPKGASFAEMDNDPDRLSLPMIRRDGVLIEATWDEAFALVADRLGEVVREHGGASVGVYLGNPNAHTVAGSLYPPLIVRGLGTHQAYSASTLDQMPKHVVLGYLFGSPSPSPCPISTAPTILTSSARIPLSPKVVWPPQPTFPASCGHCVNAAGD